MPTPVAYLTLRWFVGLVLMVLVRALLEQRLPDGAAMGLGFAAFLFVWIPTVPPEAYARTSSKRKVLYARLALFLLAAAVSSVLYPLLSSVEQNEDPRSPYKRAMLRSDLAAPLAPDQTDYRRYWIKTISKFEHVPVPRSFAVH